MRSVLVVGLATALALAGCLGGASHDEASAAAPEDQVSPPGPAAEGSLAGNASVAEPAKPRPEPEPRQVGDGYLVDNTTVQAEADAYAVYLAQGALTGEQGDAFRHTPSVPIPELTVLLVGLSWDGGFPGCQDEVGPCTWQVAPYRNGTAVQATRLAGPAGPHHQVVVFESAQAFADAPGANRSSVELNVYATQCEPLTPGTPAAGPEGECLPQALGMPETSIHLRIEAWRTAPDVDAFVARLGA